MKIEEKIVDKKKGVVQITTSDERWYALPRDNKPTKYIPSVTWILSYYYKSPHLIKWIADRGMDEAEQARNQAGDKGSRIHKAIADLLAGKEIKHNAKYSGSNDPDIKELTAEEWYALMTFRNFWADYKPKLIASEILVHNDKYAGTVDLIVKIDEETWLIDIKTSQSVQATHQFQVSAYKHAYKKKIDRLGILQVGYQRSHKGYKLTEVEDRYSMFEVAYQIWEYEVSQKQPPQREYPLTIKL